MSINQNIDQLVVRLQRRDLISSRQTALETAQLLYRFVGSARYNSIEQLLEQIKAVGKRLIAANPKELAVGNIVRKVLRLIREEYRAACLSQLEQEGQDLRSGSNAEGHSVPGTPMPPTPGIHVPASHWLSDNSNKSPFFTNEATGSPSSYTNSTGYASPPQARPVPTQLSTFVQMRHTRAQLERAGSTTNLFGLETTVMTPGPMMDSLFSPVPQNETSGSYQPHRNSFPGLSALGDSLPNARQETPPQSPRQPRSAVSGMTAKQNARLREQKAMQMKPVLVDAIREVVDEIETTHETCAKGAKEHIHSSEIILTIGYSKTVEAFLKSAWKDRNFTVICAESSPSRLGTTMAKALAKHNIPTVLVPDSSIYALMPRVTKVILGAHSVLANGGLFAIGGSLLAAVAARAQSTPVVVVAGQYKFAPTWNLYNDPAALDFGDPSEVLSFEEGEFLDKVDVANPFYDYIKPELISLFITNEGDHSPAYIYKLVNEAYDEADVEL